MWADNYITKLLAGETVQFRPRGNSMTPLIESGDLVTLVMATKGTVKVGDIVLCKVKGAQYLHLVKAIDETKDRYQIGNNHGGINGWAQGSNIYGLLVKVEK
jgi:signal peptidase I